MTLRLFPFLAALAAAALLAGCANNGMNGGGGGNYLTDQAMEQRVHTALDELPALPMDRIRVSARDGDIWLHGTVFDVTEQDRVVRAVAALEGVERVHDRLYAPQQGRGGVSTGM